MMYTAMIEMESHAARSHCRITRWRCTEYEATMLSLDLAFRLGIFSLEIYDAILRGEVHVCGAQVIVRK